MALEPKSHALLRTLDERVDSLDAKRSQWRDRIKAHEEQVSKAADASSSDSSSDDEGPMPEGYVKPAKEKAQKAEEGSAVAEGGAGGGAEGSESEAMDTRDGGSGDDGAKKKKGTKKVRFAAHVPGVHRGPRLPEPGMSFQLGRGRPLAVVLAEVLGVPGAPPTPEARPALRRQTTSCPGETVQAAS